MQARKATMAKLAASTETKTPTHEYPRKQGKSSNNAILLRHILFLQVSVQIQDISQILAVQKEPEERLAKQHQN